jgi:putative addiction module killer protein
MMPVNIMKRTKEFDRWLIGLPDLRARAKIVVRMKRAELGHLGDCKPVGDGIAEMRIDWGPGYRVYFAREGRVVYLLLLGGTKSTQDADISRAKALWQTIRRDQECTKRIFRDLMPRSIWTARK